MDWNKILLAAALGLLAQSQIGYLAFPFGDDFAYAPLAEQHANPALYPRDLQLQLFKNHALVYEWIYALGNSGFGVELVFRIAIWLLAAGTAVVLLFILNAVGAPFAALPAILGIGVIVRVDGLGRGDFGGLISPFFHHHNVALTLLLGAIAAGFMRKNWFAGGLLGLAAYAQPMTAFHGALAAGLGGLFRNPRDSVKMAVASIIVAIPAAVAVFGAVFGAPESAATLDLVHDAYRFRVPAHYDPPWSDVGLGTLYLAAGWAGIGLLARSGSDITRFSTGLMAGFTLLHLVTVIVYKGEIAEWVGFFILDANRSTPLLFVLGPALALAGMHRAKKGPAVLATGVVLLAIIALNSTVAGLVFVALGVVLYTFEEVRQIQKILFVGLIAALALLFPPDPEPPGFPEATLSAFSRIRAETPHDALFVIPVGLFHFRHYTQRSAYVDFKLFSVAQTDQAALTRSRLEEIARPSPEHRGENGWRAIQMWEADQHRAATCARMLESMAVADADYYLRSVGTGEVIPDCPTLPRSIQTETLALYGPPG